MKYETIHDLRNISNNIELVKYEDRIAKNLYYDEFYEKYKKNIPEVSDCFLTVLIRTQGKRLEGLRECLLCLWAQKYDDYEIIIIGHKVDETQEAGIQEIICEQVDHIKEKIRYVRLNTGTRTAPLNLGFSLAKGKYISVYDDDDILFDNWAESFAAGAADHDGRILRTYAVSQTWQQNKDDSYRSESKIDATYCRAFDLLEQLTVNRSPLMTMAFPTYLFQVLGITFNENLNITEDWEYLMRTVYICGITDIGVPTAIYRFWKNIETSATAHSQEMWDQAYEEIENKLAYNGLYIPPEESGRLIALIKGDAVIHGALSGSTSAKDICRLYYSFGAPFDDAHMLTSENTGKYPFFNCWYSFEECLSRMHALRFDMGQDGLFILKDFMVELTYMDDSTEQVKIDQCAHTGVRLFGELIFLFQNPVIVWEMPDKLVKYVHVSGTVSRSLQRNGIQSRGFEILHSLNSQGFKRRLHKKGWF